MQTAAKGQEFLTTDVIHRISAALLFVAAERVAGVIFNLVGRALAYYLLAICLAGLSIWLVRRLGDTPLLRDLQEISFYDVLVGILGLALQQAGKPAAVFWVLSAAVGYLRVARLLWWRRNAEGELQLAWPVFGLLGLLIFRAQSRVQDDYPVAEKGWVFACCGLAVLIPTGLWLVLGRTDEGVYLLVIIFALLRVVRPVVDAINAATAERDRLTRENATLEVRAELGARFKERNTDLCHATHDSKGPIMGLLNMAEALEHNTDPEVTRATARHLVSGLHEFGNLLSEIIMMAQVTTETVSPNADMIDMRALMWRIRQVVADEARKRKVMLALDDPCFYVKSNKWLLTRIITNLTMNAIVHGSKSSMVQIRIYPRNGNCYISIWDTGRGIPNANGPDRAANFTNLVNSVHQRPAHIPPQSDNVLAGGHGLGLKSVMRMCNTLGITMTLIAKPGWGSKFRFSVPLAAPDEKRPLIATQVLFDMMQAELAKPPAK
jgi:signal transduction histidine kinase